jgi:hypothetical protein
MNVAEVLANPLSKQLLTSHIPARFAYTGVDGDPRVVPIGFLWTGSNFKIYTVPTSAKVKALKKNPRVALTIDTEGFPPNVLLIRGSAELELVDGVPDGYVEAGRKVVPDWAKLLDFETTLPKAVEDLMKEYGDPR